MYAFDTNTCIDFLRGRLPIGYDLLKKSDPSMFKLPSIVVAELLLGAEKSERRDENLTAVKRFLEPFDVLDFDAEAAAIYARIRADLERKGLPIGPNDLVVASTALAHGATLVTRNIKEFKRVPGLALESWQEVDFDDAE